MKRKISILLAVLSLFAPSVFMPLIVEKRACIDVAVHVPTNVGELALKRSQTALYRCMIENFEAIASSRILPSFLVVPVWPFSQSLAAMFAVSQTGLVPEASNQFLNQLQYLEYFWDAKSNPPGYNSTIETVFERGHAKYYDDNNWIGFVLLDAYQVYKQDWMLQRAVQIWKLEVAGTVGTDALPKPGGVFWTQKEGWTYRSTVGTAGAAQLALRLYKLTHEQRYLEFAIAQLHWVDKYLLAPDGLYWDGIEGDGSINNAGWTYNQGLMLGNFALLYEITGDNLYLQKAEHIAAAAIASYSVNNRFWLQPPEFNAIFFWNLLRLEAVGGHSQYRPLMQRYAAQLRDNLNLMGRFIYNGPSEDIAFMTQSAAVQVLADLERALGGFK